LGANFECSGWAARFAGGEYNEYKTGSEPELKGCGGAADFRFYLHGWS